ncbi:transcription factor TFIIIC subunit tfc4 [Savitreella phatthalungensis]
MSFSAPADQATWLPSQVAEPLHNDEQDVDYAGAARLDDPDLWSDDEGADASGPMLYGSTEENPLRQLRADLEAAAPFRGRSRRQKIRKPRIDAQTQAGFHESVQLGQANTALGEGDLTTAKELVEGIIGNNPKVFDAWLVLANVYELQEDFSRAYTAWLFAAGLRERSSAVWQSAARSAMRAEMFEEADHAYDRAIKTASDGDVEGLCDERIELLRSYDSTPKTRIECYKAMLRRNPHDMRYVRPLAEVYNTTAKPVQAIELFDEAADFWIASSDPRAREIFGFNQLNILAELYMTAADGNRRPFLWPKLVTRIRTISRWINFREAETFWDAKPLDDREFDEDDERRSELPQYHADAERVWQYDLPIELRLRLARARMTMGHTDEALRHFGCLLSQEEPSFDTADLFQDAGYFLMDRGMYTQAIDYLQPLLDVDQVGDPDLWSRAARCYIEVDELDAAEQCLMAVLQVDATDRDATLRLAEVYQRQNRRDQALELITQLMQQPAEDMVTDVQQPVAPQQDTTRTGTRRPKGTGKAKRRTAAEERRLTAQRQRESLLNASSTERGLQEDQKAEATDAAFRTLALLREDMLSGDEDALNTWSSTVLELSDDFRAIRTLYPYDKRQIFCGIEDGLEESETKKRRAAEPPIEADSLRGQSVDAWLRLFVQGAACLVVQGNSTDAFEVLGTAMAANVFYQHRDRMWALQKAKLLLAIKAGAAKVAQEVLRTILTDRPLHRDLMRLYCAIAPGGLDSQDAYDDDNFQKFMLRMIKALDLMTGLAGGAGETHRIRAGKDFEGNFRANRPTEHGIASTFMLYGMLVAAGRSYVPLLHYLARSQARCPAASKEDPMQHLLIALTYLHRAMQRQVDNRHLQVIQALSFFKPYQRLRYATGDHGLMQEADYNMGRAMQHLGLNHLALPFYDKVLAHHHTGQIDPKHDLAPSAAYNMHLIHSLGGATSKARELLHRYVTVV